MNKVITISREFGSGGRKAGKREKVAAADDVMIKIIHTKDIYTKIFRMTALLER